MLFLHALQVWILLTVILTINSYVLFSANLEDFKYLAQKFVPENLAVKLTEIVSESSLDKRQDRDGGEQRKITIDDEKPWKIDNENKYYENSIERTEVQTVRFKTTQTTTESLFEPDRMHEKDYDRLQDTTYPRIMGKRYKTVQRMATTKEWFEKPPSFLKMMSPQSNPKSSDIPSIPKSSDIPSHSIYYKEIDTNDGVKPSYPERDINKNYERNNKENSGLGRDEGSNSKQMMQYFPVENQSTQYKKQTNNETEKVRVNGRDISRIKQRKIRKLETKGKDDAMVFDTIIMGKKKDSYEDYATPKKDDDYLISDGIVSSKKRPIPSTERGSTNRVSRTTKIWPMQHIQKDDKRGHGITLFSRKQPHWSTQKDSNKRIAPTTRERPNWSPERDLSDRISPTTSERTIWSEQREVDGGTPETRRPPIFSIQRQRKEKPTTATEETFPDYIEREWMTTETKTLPTENEWMATERYTTEKEKITQDYVQEKQKKDKIQPFDSGPVYGKEDVKARTESLLFDSKELDDNQTSASRYTMRGTGIPTREYYKMSTPDYYKKLPRIVEKYDFNEPIPEADREREKIDDRFAKEPARVNHKVRQQQEKSGLLEYRHRKKAGPKEKQNQARAGPLESILENIGFRFKAIEDVTESANVSSQVTIKLLDSKGKLTPAAPKVRSHALMSCSESRASEQRVGCGNSDRW